MPELLHIVKPERKTDFHTRHLRHPCPACEKEAMKFRLAQQRAKSGMTQTQVADAIGISVALYNQLESGKRRINEDHISALADLYRISPVELIVDPVRDDPLWQQLDRAWRQLTPAEREIVASSIKGIVASRDRS